MERQVENGESRFSCVRSVKKSAAPTALVLFHLLAQRSRAALTSFAPPALGLGPHSSFDCQWDGFSDMVQDSEMSGENT